MRTLTGRELPISIDEFALRCLCEQWKVKSLEVFGSVLREDWDPEKSDVDFMVEYQPHARISYFDRMHMRAELEELLGFPVDLLRRRVVEKDPNPYRKDPILREAEPIYVAA